MRTRLLLIGWVVLVVAAAYSLAAAGPSAAERGATAIPRLNAISARSDGRTTSVLIEASEPVAYVTSRPDPLTVLVELRNVTAAGAANRFSASRGSAVTGVSVDDGRAPDGALLARVTVKLNAPAAHRVKSSRNVIQVDIDRDPLGAARAPLDADPDALAAGPASAPDATASGPPQAATMLRGIRTGAEPEGTSVTLMANGKLVAGSVDMPKGLPHRLVLEFPDVGSSLPAVTTVQQGPIDKILVAAGGANPPVTRVVIDLVREVVYRVEPAGPDGRDLKIVFFPDDRSPVVADSLVALGAQAGTIDPMSALKTVETPERVQETALVQAGASTAPPTAVLLQPQPPAPKTPPQATPTSQPPASKAPPQVTPTSQPPAAPPSGQAPPPAALTSKTPQESVVGRGERQYTGHPVSIDFQGADLRAVLRVFSEISGLNIVIDPAVQGTVDVALRDVPWDQALDIILRANKLGYSIDGTIVRIAPLTVLAEEEGQRRRLADEQALTGELRVLTKTLSYSKAEELRELLLRSALSRRGIVQVDPRTNTLIITDLPAALATASELITALDKPQPQVEIEARIVQTTRNAARALGVQWGILGRMTPELGNTTPLAFPNQGSLTGRAGSQGPTGDPNSQTPSGVNLPASNPTSAIGLMLGSVNGAFSLDLALSALESSGNGRILSTPRVSTQNNVEAEIMQGIQIPIQTIANNTVTVSFKDAALTLKVTPQITAANTIIMKIALENAAPDYSRSINNIPPIDTQRANTQVLVKDGETTVIGGIYVSREQVTNDRTPGLSKIPLLGWLFRRDSTSDESRELLIFITPRIAKS
jgi:type IV pilus assembly protein PilQ